MNTVLRLTGQSEVRAPQGILVLVYIYANSGIYTQENTKPIPTPTCESLLNIK